MARVVIYTKSNCPYCGWAKQLLDSRKTPYQEISIENDPEKRGEVERLSGRRTLPQIFINDQSIGGYDDLAALEKSGGLETLLK